VRFTIMLPTDRYDLLDEFVNPAAVSELSRAAERLGYDAVSVTEHPAPEEQWLATGGHQALDPFVALSFAAAATTTLRVQTYLTVVPYRNPWMLAKAAASLDVLSAGRLILGIGPGYLEPEFTAVGADFEHRNDVTDQHIAVVKEIWTGELVEVQGPDGTSKHRALPRPVQLPHPPIWVGGNSKRAIRRAVELGDAWMPMANPKALVARRRSAALENVDDLAAGIAQAREHAAKVGRTTHLTVATSPFTPTTGDPAAVLAEVHALAAVGVEQLCIAFRADTRDAFLAQMEQIANDVVRPAATIAPAPVVGPAN
jgi:probable F420-dependent oxidoreductase